MGPHWFYRMALWARNPPSARRVLQVFGLIAVLLLIFGLERFGYWPEALTTQRMKP
jgi:hypothetical protein